MIRTAGHDSSLNPLSHSWVETTLLIFGQACDIPNSSGTVPKVHNPNGGGHVWVVGASFLPARELWSTTGTVG